MAHRSARYRYSQARRERTSELYVDKTGFGRNKSVDTGHRFFCWKLDVDRGGGHPHRKSATHSDPGMVANISITVGQAALISFAASIVQLLNRWLQALFWRRVSCSKCGHCWMDVAASSIYLEAPVSTRFIVPRYHWKSNTSTSTPNLDFDYVLESLIHIENPYVCERLKSLQPDDRWRLTSVDRQVFALH